MEKYFYLQDSRSYVGNDVLWWAKEGKGYTTDLSKAEVFTFEKAQRYHNDRGTDIPWPKEYIDQRTRPAVDVQYIDRDVALIGTGLILKKPEKRKTETFKCKCGRFVSEREYYERCYHGEPCRKCEIE